VKRAKAKASPARRLALRVLYDADEKGAFVNLALDRALESSRLSPADRALVTEMVYGVTRWRGRLDWVIDSLSTTPSRRLPTFIRNILRMGLYQLLFLERIPSRAAVYESVALAREFGHRGTAALVNAVLRRAAGPEGAAPLPDEETDPVRRLAVEFSHPEWLVRRWLDLFGPEETRRLCRVDNEPAPLTLRVNRTRTTRERLVAALEEEGIEASRGAMLPEAVVCRIDQPLRSLRTFAEGWFSVQDEGAMTAARVLAPQAGWLVVDACAGVGGKSTHLAELMGDRGRVVAVDLFEHKLRLVQESAGRLGLGSIETRCLDARELPSSDLAGAADAVLVDAPCTGTGVLRRRPDLRWRLEEEDLTKLVRLQREILAAAATCVRPGGILVYATCSIDPAENQELVEGFLELDLELKRDNAAREAGLDAARHGSGPDGCYLSLRPRSGGPDGFFAARLVRRGRGRE